MHTARDNYSLGSAGLVAGTTSTISVANAVAYCIAGRSYLKAAALNVVLALKTGGVALPVLAANQASVIFLFLDAAGALTYSAAAKSDGTARVGVSATGASYLPGAFEWPQEEAGFAIIGAVKITTNASGAFTIGTTALGAANTTATFYNVANDLGVSVPF